VTSLHFRNAQSYTRFVNLIIQIVMVDANVIRRDAAESSLCA
jgi:hypothetical protein